MRGSRVAAVVVLLGVLGASPPASAWRQAWTRNDPRQPMHIDGDCVVYTIQRDGSRDVPFEDARAAIDTAVSQWTDVACSHVTFIPTEPASCCRVGYSDSGPNANCVQWREDAWPEDEYHDPDAVALTTLTYERSTGRILDSDVEMNGFRFTFTTSDTGVEFDVWNTMAHEAGHMFGLDESDVSSATMSPRTYAGDLSNRDLSADDVEAACTIYPIADDPHVCRAPLGGLDLNCAPTGDGCGCRAAGAPGAAVPSILAVVVSILVLRSLGRGVRVRAARRR